MLRRVPRPLALIVTTLLATSLAACGGEKSTGLGDKTVEGWDAAKVSGAVGTAPKVDWKGKMDTVAKPETRTLTEGNGPAVAQGGKVWGYIWIGNGFTAKQAYSDYDNKQPEELTADSKTLSPVFAKMLTGTNVGSRVAAIANAKDIFGDGGNPTLGVANEDPLLIVVDLVAPAVDKPTDTTDRSKLPKLKPTPGKPTVPAAMDFTGVPKPTQNSAFLRTTLKQGTGTTVTSDMTVKVNYLGMVYGAKKPFDESYTKQPAQFGLGQVVKGWTYGLTGVKVGSRVLLQIPPLLGYGAQAQSGIPANSTLYFVVDVLSATKASPSASASPSAQ
ncbi:FKBP-type peptidyl-prolyl cis-trans isomerase [Nocardioides sp. CER19]|uniref:FKBP-type peptidyl-prolyl cis-trans isomerase n=1 Tax=Nocardioides sp. CER19 TaxID=3038538 RepID=UPI00244B95CF|nr:FKBP-type peptidyl-prolyl cis-trans isomerase [Nocardioides sp. CER19]MDH2415667.1 FKBP-type peptidyl-prolyl cis-trans isomerase [Nocardioides sp. CER19]